MYTSDGYPNALRLIVVLLIAVISLVSQPANSSDFFQTDQTNILNDNQSSLQMTRNLASRPLFFTQNQGQWNALVQFRANAGGTTMWFGADGTFYQFRRTIKSDDDTSRSGDATRPGMQREELIDRQPEAFETMMIKAKFVGANPEPIMTGIDMMEYKCNYFIGNDQSRWRTDVPNYKAVLYEEIYNGIDLKYYGNGQQMEYDFIVKPGADYNQIKIQYEGAESIAINDNGELVVTTIWGEVTEQRPVIYQIAGGSRVMIDGAYNLQPDNSFSFELGGYDPTLPLVIDPILSYSTYLGGTRQDNCFGFTVDNSGNAYVTGWTASNDFPFTSGSLDTTFNSSSYMDAFVTKLSPDGSALVYSTFLGGNDTENGYDIEVDESGNVYIIGDTRSTDFPITAGAIQTTTGGTYYDAFVTKLNPSGNALVFSTFLGGSKNEDCYSIALDSVGNIYICGTTESSNFPTTAGVIQEAFIGGGFYTKNDAFVAKLNPTATALIYSTYLGGNNIEKAWAIEADNAGNAYITGYTLSTDFPTTVGAFQPIMNGTMSSAYLTKLNPTGTALVYGTYLGGVGSDIGYGIAVDTSGHAYVTGMTNGSADFPTTAGAYKTTFDGSIDAFITKFSSTGDSLIFSTYFGGTDTEHTNGIALDKSDNVYIAGHTASTNLPTTEGAFQTVNMGGPYDGFMAKFDNSGSSLDYCTYMGGASASEAMYDIALDKSANIFFAGKTSSSTFPTTEGAYQQTYEGSGGDAFIVKFSASPSCCSGSRGDVNGDGAELDIVDLTCIVDFLWGSGCNMPCTEEADVNGDGAMADIVDLTFVVDWLWGTPPSLVDCP